MFSRLRLNGGLTDSPYHARYDKWKHLGINVFWMTGVLDITKRRRFVVLSSQYHYVHYLSRVFVHHIALSVY